MVPLIVPLIAYILGIIASSALDTRSVWLCLPLAVLVGVAKPKLSVLPIFLIGSGLRALEPPAPPPPDLEPVRVVGLLGRAPEWRGLGVYLDLQVETLDGRPAFGRARLTEFLDEPELKELFEELELGRGDRVEILVRLRRPVVYRNPGAFDFRRHLERQGIYWTGTIRNPRLITILDRGWHHPDLVVAWVRKRVTRHFDSDQTVAGLVKGMVLGQKHELTAEVERQFQAGGLYHLVVVSGFNLAVVAAAAGWASRYLVWKRSIRWAIVAVCTLAYAGIAQGEASVTRATIMALVLILSRILDRGYSPLNAIAASAFLILTWQPNALEDPGFQMTFAAVLAVVGIGAPCARWIFGALSTALIDFADIRRDGHLPAAIADFRVSRRLWCERHRLPFWVVTIPWRAVQFTGEAFVVAVAAHIVMAFFMVESFHRLSALSPFLNVPAGFIAAVVTPLGLLTILLPSALAAPLSWVLTELLHILLALPVHSFRTPSVPPWLWCGYAVVVGILVCTVRRQKALGAALSLAGLIGMQIVIASADFSPAPPKYLTLTFLDVGQGDSTLVEFPDGRRILIDGGGIAAGRFLNLRDESTFSIGEDVVSRYLFSRRIRRLNTVVLTHAHHDHMDGLFDVAANFEIGEAWLGKNPAIPRYRELLELFSKRTIPIRWVSAGMEVGGVRILHPPADWNVRKTAHNNDSLVLQIGDALLTGDLEAALPGAPQRVFVLKIPHHGSRNTRLNVQAAIRVISVGASNPFGHPHASRLPAWRTDELGAISVRGNAPPTDGPIDGQFD